MILMVPYSVRPRVLHSVRPMVLYSVRPMVLHSVRLVVLYSVRPMVLFSVRPMVLYSVRPMVLYSVIIMVLYSVILMVLYSVRPVVYLLSETNVSLLRETNSSLCRYICFLYLLSLLAFSTCSHWSCFLAIALIGHVFLLLLSLRKDFSCFKKCACLCVGEFSIDIPVMPKIACLYLTSHNIPLVSKDHFLYVSVISVCLLFFTS